MIKHKAKLNISRPSYGDGREKISITVKDVDAGLEFLEIEIDLDRFAKCITGQPMMDCEMEFSNLVYVGKKREREKIEFKLDEGSDYREKEAAALQVEKHVPEGWIASTYFGSQDSIFSRDGGRWARTQINRWVDKGE
jgi:hypothetical protein